MGIPNCNLTLCRYQTEKFENEESSLETKDYIIIALIKAKTKYYFKNKMYI
jgi:hypothetical protein